MKTARVLSLLLIAGCVAVLDPSVGRSQQKDMTEAEQMGMKAMQQAIETMKTLNESLPEGMKLDMAAEALKKAKESSIKALELSRKLREKAMAMTRELDKLDAEEGDDTGLKALQHALKSVDSLMKFIGSKEFAFSLKEIRRTASEAGGTGGVSLERMDAQLEALQSNIERQLEKMEAALDEQMDRMDAQLEAQMKQLEEKMKRMEEELEKNMDELERSLDGMDEEVEADMDEDEGTRDVKHENSAGATRGKK